ncbi:hypothetical protein JCM8097_009106 [Rhodosporidiobolus ruineniae]
MASHELQVDGDRVLERDEHGNVISTKDYTRVHAGYAAAAHNKKLSSETREHAEEIMHDLEAAHGDDEGIKPSGSPKASHSKPAAEHAKHHHKDTPADDEDHAAEVHEHRVIGGYKAALHRDTTSDEAKQHAREKLGEMGVDPDTLYAPPALRGRRRRRRRREEEEERGPPLAVVPFVPLVQ